MVRSIDEIKKKIDRITELPTLPIIITELLGLLDNPKSTPKDINELIKNDQSLTSKTLRLVNSSYYGFPRAISTVTEAVVILGFDTVRNLALSASIVKVLKNGGSFNKNEFWYHTVAVAFMTRIIAKHIKYPKIEVAFVAGLLHDIAKVFEDQYFEKEFIEAIRLSKEKGEQLYKVEREVLGYDHAAIGKRLADSWSLPESIVAAMAYHHDLDKNIYPEHTTLVEIVYISDVLVRLKKMGNSGNYGKTGISKKILEKLKIKKDDLVQFLKKLEKELEKGNSFIELFND